MWWLGLGGVVCGREEAWVEAGPTEGGGYQATLCGHFSLSVAGDAPFRMRLLFLCLRLLEVPGARRGGPDAGRAPVRGRPFGKLRAGSYDISQVPMVSLCTGLSVAWPLEVAQNRVPNS